MSDNQAVFKALNSYVISDGLRMFRNIKAASKIQQGNVEEEIK